MLETAIQDGPRDQYRTVGPPRRQKSHDVADARQINDLVAITDGPLLTTVLKSASPLEKSRWSLWFARVELIFWRVERTTADKSTIDADDKAVSRTVKPRHGIYHILTIPVRLVGQKIEPNVCLVLGTQLEEKGMSTQDRVASRNEANPRYCRRYAREYGVLPFDAWNPERSYRCEKSYRATPYFTINTIIIDDDVTASILVYGKDNVRCMVPNQCWPIMLLSGITIVLVHNGLILYGFWEYCFLIPRVSFGYFGLDRNAATIPMFGGFLSIWGNNKYMFQNKWT